MPAADSLGDAIEKAIGQSDALIVLCSPDAARSPWIAREVELYKRLNGDRNVFPVIVEGDPPGNFPAPLLQRYENGEPTGTQAEPIAADLRRDGDGRKLGKLKIVAGLAGIDLDTLVQRDTARRQKRLVAIASAAVLGMVGTSALALYAIDQRDEAREQRAEADGLIEYMLTDLREQLEPVGRLEVLDGVGRRAMDYYARQKLEDLSDSELGRRARATLLVAEVQNERGNNEAALPAFREAARSTRAILDRNPDDPEAMYNHGQSLFWVGYVAWQHGKIPDARRALEGYANLSRRLAARDRGNLEWQQEEAYSLSNLGSLAYQQGQLEEALKYFRQSAASLSAISKAEGHPAEREIEIADAYSWISSTHQNLGRFRDALAERKKELAIFDAQLAKDPQNNSARRQSIGALAAFGSVSALLGDKASAAAALDRSIAEGEAQLRIDPGNTSILDWTRGALRERALLAWSDKRSADASRDFDRIEAILAQLQQRDPDNSDWNGQDAFETAVLRAFTDRAAMSGEQRKSLAATVRKRLEGIGKAQGWLMVAADFLEGTGWAAEGNQAQARAAFTRALAREQEGEVVEPRAIALRAAAASRLGLRAQEEELKSRLQKLGVRAVLEGWVGVDS